MQRGGSSSRGGARGGSSGSSSGSRFASSASFAAAYASNPDLGSEPVQEPLKRTKELEVAPAGVFRKEVTCGGRTPLKSSQAKKFKQLVQDVFKHVSEAELALLFPSKFLVHTEKLTGPLLTEHKPWLYWVKDESDSSSSGKNDIGLPMFIDFSGGHADHHMVYPTIYALTRAPSLLRPLLVHPQVSRYAVGGADIMAPGVLWPRDAEFGIGRFQQGEKRAVFARGNPVPFAVGWLSQDSASLIAAGGKGKAVSVVHVYQDSLWNLGNRHPPNDGFTAKEVYAIEQDGQEEDAADQGDAGVEDPLDAMMLNAAAASSSAAGASSAAAPASRDSWDSDAATDATAPLPAEREDVAAAADSADVAAESQPAAAATSSGQQEFTDASLTAAAASEDKEPDSQDGHVAAADDATQTADDEAASAAVTEEADAGDSDPDAEADGGDDEDSNESKKASTGEMDAALLRCFLLAIQTRIRDSDLPMTPSEMLSHMECCNVEAGSERLDVKRSSHKKLAKFLKQLGKLGLAKSKTGGGKQGLCTTELMVMSVSRSSPMLQDAPVTQAFIDAMRKKEKSHAKAHARSAADSAAAAASSGASASASSNSGGAAKGALNIIHAYRPDQKLQRFLFTGADDAKRFWNMKDAKQVLWNYTQANNLDAAQGQRVKLDAALHATFYADTGKNIAEVTKADISHKFDAHMNEYHAITFGFGDESEVKFKAGPVPSIEVSVEQRQGKKQMTKVHGIEVFGIEPAVFAKDAQKAFSCSCTTASVPASAKHRAYEEVLIQGNVASDVGAKLQQLYNIPAQLVKVAKKGGK